MKELQLSNGAYIRVRPMPPHVVIQFNRGVSRQMPPEPKAPVKRVTMADGHVEDDIITDGPEWDAYQKDLNDWMIVSDAVMADANDEYNVLQRDYVISEWSFNREHWQTDAPESWEFPPALERAGIKPCGNRRVDFIGIELLTTAEDWVMVRSIAEGQITDEEAGRARAGFRTGDRRAGDATAKKTGWLRRLALKVSRRDGGG